MSKWTDRFASHAFYGVWKSLKDLLIDSEIAKRLNEDSVQDIARLKKVISYLDGIVQNLDPELTPFNHFTNIQNLTQACFNELNAFKGNGNIAHLENANNQADTLLLQFHQIPASLYSISPQNINSAVTEYAETIGTYITKYKNETEYGVIELKEKIEILNSELKEKEVMINNLQSELTTVKQTIQSQTTEFNTQYQKSENERSEKFTKALDTFAVKADSLYSKYESQSDEEFKNLSTKTSKIVEVLLKLQDDASQVYGVTINTLQGGAYSSYANEEKKSANLLRFLAALLMLIGVGFLIIPEIILIYKNGGYAFDWVKVLGRTPLSLVIFVPAFYFARESGKHRTNEVANRRRQHILTTLDPYIELMEKDKAQELKSHVAKTIFSEVNPSTTPDKETGNIISQLANLAKQIKGG